MRFEVPANLLQRLRARRARQRHERGEPRLSPVTPRSFLDGLRELFASAESAAADHAEAYVQAMWQWRREIEDAHDAFLLHPGMGPMLYITADGRTLVDGRGWDGEPLREASDYEAVGAIIIGSEKTSIPDLLSLLPAKPADAENCSRCSGSRCTPIPGHPVEIRCPDFLGLGWIRRDLD